ncbi:MAG: hypothetical protein V1921_01105 [Candidatus Altiarchaeota archaeon]
MGEVRRDTVDFAARVDLIRDVIRDLEGNQELADILGVPVAEKLVFVGKKDNFGIAPIEFHKIAEDKLLRVQNILEDTLGRNLKSHKK